MSGPKSNDDLEYFKKGEDGELIPDYDQTINVFEEGDIISGVIIKIDRDEVLVDVGYKSEGVIPQKELTIRGNRKTKDIVTEGQQVDALVLQKEDVDGRLILSKKRADFQKAWDEIEECCKSNKTVEGDVIEVVKGGLILDIGLRGFLPASLVELHRVKDLKNYLSQKLRCKIIETDRRRNNVVLSRRAVLESERRDERRKILDKLEIGQVLTGKISSIVDFGAFVDLGGIDGLIHISELSWTHVNHPSEVVDIGKEVNVQVLEIDYVKERVSLGLKQTQTDPWKDIPKEFKVNQKIKGQITKIVPFGAFLELNDGIEGLIHISELASEDVDEITDVINIGDETEAVITEIELDRRRISLSIKKLFEEEEVKEKEKTEATSEKADKARAEKEGESKEEQKDISAEPEKEEAVSGKEETVVKDDIQKEKAEEKKDDKSEETEISATKQSINKIKAEEKKDIMTEEAEKDIAEKAEQAEQEEQTEQAEKIEKEEQVEQTEQAKQAKQAKQADKAEKEEQAEKIEKEEQEEQEEKIENEKQEEKEEKLLTSTLDQDDDDELPDPGSLEDVLQDMKDRRNTKS